MSWSKTGITHYLAQLGLPDKGREIKGLVVCNSFRGNCPERNCVDNLERKGA